MLIYLTLFGHHYRHRRSVQLWTQIWQSRLQIYQYKPVRTQLPC